MVRQAAGNLGYRIQGTRFTPKQLFNDDVLRVVEFDDVVCRFMFDVRQDLRFLQIGAYDGVSTDPLRKYIDRCGWQGVLVEPQPHCARQLRELYSSNPRLQVVEAAIDAQPGSRNLYIVEGDDCRSGQAALLPSIVIMSCDTLSSCPVCQIRSKPLAFPAEPLPMSFHS